MLNNPDLKAMSPEVMENFINNDEYGVVVCLNCGYKDIAEKFYFNREVQCNKCFSQAVAPAKEFCYAPFPEED